MATDNSGPHLPPSWPEAPRREAPSWASTPSEQDSSPSWAGTPAAEVPMSWPESPRPAGHDPSWPEPPRPDSSWPEPPRPSRGGTGNGTGHGPGNGANHGAGHSAANGNGPGYGGPNGPGYGGANGPGHGGANGAAGEGRRAEPPRSYGSQDPGPSWPEPPRPDSGWPEPPRKDGGAPAWAGERGDGRSPAPGPMPNSGPNGRPDPMNAGPGRMPDPMSSGSGRMPDPAFDAAPHRVPDPVPAWQQPPSPSPGAWANLSTPAPWPPRAPEPVDLPEARPFDGGPAASAPAPSAPVASAPASFGQAAAGAPAGTLPHEGPSGPHGPPPQTSEERTITYGRPGETHIGTPPTGPDEHGHPPHQGSRAGSNLSRDPSDPENRFVTAGQISGSRTPPPERQQELWNTVFGDNYESMGERDPLDDDDEGKPIWIYALGGSVAIALVAALLWAFLAGPLAGEDPASTAAAGPTASQKASTTKSATSIGPLPKYPGKASPVIGRVPDQEAGISVPRLGGTWQLDQRATVKATYGYGTRQYVPITEDKSAMVMSGPLPERLASYYDQDDLEPVIKQVVLDARKRFFPSDNKVRKVAQQAIKVGDKTGRLIAYSLTSGTDKATIVTMAVNTGGSVPAIVFVSIPAESKQLLPDIRVVMNQLRLG
ncbi:hypothetical protein ACI2LC_00565 [Nonomuraea wenchangensis]|uniref:hypothetical protein n=1 Tax=Nonomuraea wenchangensis TaxID=568860 RepID=UPI0037B80D13